jgi:hypothetical protein
VWSTRKDSSDYLFAIDDTPFWSSGLRAECTQCDFHLNNLHSTFKHSVVTIPVEVREALDSFDWDASVQTNHNIGCLSEICDGLAPGQASGNA